MQMTSGTMNDTKNHLKLNINSEIGELQSVILKRPGIELENLTPDTLEELLFDDIPFLEVAQQEHDVFAKTLLSQGAEVYYLDDLFKQVLESHDIKGKIIKRALEDAHITDQNIAKALFEFLNEKSAQALCQALMAGVKKDELLYFDSCLHVRATRRDLFWLSPIPNLYFTRDPASIIGGFANINKMYAATRTRESIFIDSIFTYHPKLKEQALLNTQFTQYAIEGGDILVLDKNTLAIGISERTTPQAIEGLCQHLFFNKKLSSSHTINKVLAIEIPKRRTFMHLDTVFTQVDLDKFTIHTGAMHKASVYKLTPKHNAENALHCEELNGRLEEVLSFELDRKIHIIHCGGLDEVCGAREQWSDSANTLAIRPGEVCVYNRNKVTNHILQEHDVKVHAIPCSELSRGRGGPRCMSMPLARKTV